MPDFVTAFDLQAPAMVAFVGGGGKTSLMFALAKALPGRVVVTTTTRIFAAQMKLATAVLSITEIGNWQLKPPIPNLQAILDKHKHCLVIGQVRGDKALGVPRELPGQLLARPDVDFVLVEADGSRMRPIKAPAAHEPVIPLETTLVVPVVGIDALNGRIADVAHRPELVLSLIRHASSVNNRLMAEDAAILLTHPQGGLKGVPAGARVIPFINKVETAAQRTAARQIAGHVLRNTQYASRIPQVVIGAAKTNQPIREVHRRVTAVVLAAGQAKRMGHTKQLLPWGETTVLGQVLRNLRATAVHDSLVVTGHEAEKITAVAAAENVKSIFNPHYAAGEMLSSLQTAVARLPNHIAAILVMLADQPMVEPDTINQLLEAYWQQKSDLIAPAFKGRRGNPVLIGRAYFKELLALPPGVAPRYLLRQYDESIHLVPVTTDAVLRDLDNLTDYEQWRPTGNKKAAPGKSRSGQLADTF